VVVVVAVARDDSATVEVPKFPVSEEEEEEGEEGEEGEEEEEEEEEEDVAGDEETTSGFTSRGTKEVSAFAPPAAKAGESAAVALLSGSEGVTGTRGCCCRVAGVGMCGVVVSQEKITGWFTADVANMSNVRLDPGDDDKRGEEEEEAEEEEEEEAEEEEEEAEEEEEEAEEEEEEEAEEEEEEVNVKGDTEATAVVRV
jgi:hypothetical protein